MTKPTTYYIVPALTDQAGQCRIVSFAGAFQDIRTDGARDARDHYQKFPDKWAEAGVMNSQGKLVALDGSKATWQELRDCEPLAAGLAITVDEPFNS